jgi:antirestriction protein ArdC
VPTPGRRTDRGDEGAAMTRRSAEVGAAYLCAEAGISTALLENQAAYIAGWLRKWRARHFFNNQQEIIM